MSEQNDPPTTRMTFNSDPDGASEQDRGGEHRRAEPDTTPTSTSSATSSAGVAVVAPTTDQHGERTASPQAKIIAVLGSSAGITVIGALVTAFTGVTLDPVVLTALVGGGTGLVATVVGYLVPNRSSAN